MRVPAGELRKSSPMTGESPRLTFWLLFLFLIVFVAGCGNGPREAQAIPRAVPTPVPSLDNGWTTNQKNLTPAAEETPAEETPAPPESTPPPPDACEPGRSPFLVLMYHRLQMGGGGSLLSVPARKFREQVAWLAAQGYRSITLKMIDDYFRAGKPLPPKSVVFTFDDNHPSDYKIAAPILEEFNFRGVFFVVGAFMKPEIRARYEELRQRGHEIGSHTWSHQYLTKRHCRSRRGCCGHRGGCTEEDARRELTRSFGELRPLLGDTPTLAWPGNFYSPELIQLAVEVGYQLLFACERQVKVAGVPYVFPATTVSPLEIFRVAIDGRASLRHFEAAAREQAPITISNHPAHRYCVPQREGNCRDTSGRR
jgi:peptidoglycan/xylan/chitin deacetylase (PgdA/CDA1 family)